MVVVRNLSPTRFSWYYCCVVVVTVHCPVSRFGAIATVQWRIETIHEELKIYTEEKLKHNNKQRSSQLL